MATPISKFGQYVLLQAHSGAGDLVFETDDIKIDFDIRHIKGWSRAKITLTNLAPKTIRKLSSVTGGIYVTIKTALHNSQLRVIADGLYVSNSLEEIKVPESVFSMYCYSKLRKLYLEKQIDTKIKKPTLSKIINTCLRDTEYDGVPEFKYFPQAVLDYQGLRPSSRRQGSLISVLENLGEEFRFNTYTDDSKLVFMYKPDYKNVVDTDFYSSVGDIRLNTNNMRSNPKIGPATLSIVANLNPKIKTTSILNITDLLTKGVDVPEATLQVAEQYLKDKVSGFSKYQTLSVQHRGSNWTGDWTTQALATSPTPGTTMSTLTW